MKRVSVYTRSGRTSPSSYYRIMQYEKDLPCEISERIVVPERIYAAYNAANGLKKQWHRLRFYVVAYCRVFRFLLSDIRKKPNTIFVSRAIMPRICPFPLGFLMKKAFSAAGTVIWDVDDDIFQAREITEKEKTLLLQFADHIPVVNQHLKTLLPPEKREKAIYLPTTDGDFQDENLSLLYKSREERYQNGEIELLWLATHTGLPFLRDIVPYLDAAAEQILQKTGKQLVLSVVCSKPLVAQTQHLKIDNVVWSKKVAAEKIKNSHIGIMPLHNTTHSLSKGGFKLLQYMAVGLPNISSAVGSANEIVTHGVNGMLVSAEDLTQWTAAVVELASSWDKMLEMGKKARQRWDEAYSYKSNLKILSDLLTEDDEK